MKTTNSSNCINVRYSKPYANTMIVLGLILLISSILKFDTARNLEYILVVIIMFVVSLILVGFGINARRGKLYFSLDTENKVFIIFSGMPFITFAVRKKPFEKIYADEKNIFLENNGKKRVMNINLKLCNKSDFEAFKQKILMGR